MQQRGQAKDFPSLMKPYQKDLGGLVIHRRKMKFNGSAFDFDQGKSRVYKVRRKFPYNASGIADNVETIRQI